ncbi:tetratricopeptide repeat protein [Tateyamaria omphalii]|uniref:Uncharacterized protein n=1 Tax=Tateyamaria omphalii TaxID=299262 RepID=A0A1P8N1Y5_9RHOB|nr:hypothetical protein [Tateyamaria omphalii]APX14334.1 hypothetical protein BWR18_21045 [Tateyamaria omphalii]
MLKYVRKLGMAIGLSLVLVACQSVEEKAEKYLASAMELIGAGDTDRAVIELRNVFALVPNHIKARETLAELMLDQNDEAAAYGHYLRLVEQVPDHLEGRTVLAEIAFEARNWEEFVRHGEEAVALAPDHPRSQIIDLALRYQQSIEDRTGRCAMPCVTGPVCLPPIRRTAVCCSRCCLTRICGTGGLTRR